MSDTPTLRQTTRDLTEAAREIREDELPAVRDQIDDLEAEARREFDSAADIPAEKEAEYQQLRQQAKELHGTADTFEHYADEWADGDTCEFVLEELNGDEYAAVIDAVSQEAGRQARAEGTLPEGFGQVKALEYGVVSKPQGAPADPGLWPAAIVTDLFAQLESITAPEGVGLGNSSLASVIGDEEPDTDLPPAVDPIESEAVRPDGG
jgi:hypothetical protein